MPKSKGFYIYWCGISINRSTVSNCQLKAGYEREIIKIMRKYLKNYEKELNEIEQVITISSVIMVSCYVKCAFKVFKRCYICV